MPVLHVLDDAHVYGMSVVWCKDLRRHRSEVSVELRKAKKDDQLSKRRNMDDESEPGSPLQDKNAQVSYNFCATFCFFLLLHKFCIIEVRSHLVIWW